MDKKSINKRVSEVYKNLLKNKIVDNESQFSDKLGYRQPTINMILNNKSNAGRKLIDKIIDIYNVNRKYIEQGELPMFVSSSEVTQPTSENPENLSPAESTESIVFLKYKVQSSEKLIKHLESELEKTDELAKLKNKHIGDLEEKIKTLEKKLQKVKTH